MTATDELRRLLDERGVEWMPSVWSAKDETFYKVGDVGYLATEMSSGKMKVCIEGYLTPAQTIAATLGRGTCMNMDGETDAEWFTCSECNTELRVHEPFDAFSIHYCPNCGRKVIG